MARNRFVRNTRTYQTVPHPDMQSDIQFSGDRTCDLMARNRFVRNTRTYQTVPHPDMQSDIQFSGDSNL